MVDATMKISWFKRLYETNEGWASCPQWYGMDKIYVYGDKYLRKLLKTVKNQFWNDSIKSLLILMEQQTYQGIEALLSTPLGTIRK